MNNLKALIFQAVLILGLSTFLTAAKAQNDLYQLPVDAQPGLSGSDAEVDGYLKYFDKKSVKYKQIVSEYTNLIQSDLANENTCGLQLGSGLLKINNQHQLKDKGVAKILNYGYLTRQWDDLTYSLIAAHLEFAVIEVPTGKPDLSRTTRRFLEKNGPSTISFFQKNPACQLFTDFSIIRGFIKHHDLKKRHFKKLITYLLLSGQITEEQFKSAMMAVESELHGLNYKYFMQSLLKTKQSFREKRKALILKDSTPSQGDLQRPAAGPSANRFFLGTDPKKSPRAALYHRFSPDDINLLAQVLFKASIRLLADHAELNIFFLPEDKENVETYVLSPMEKYRMSLKMLELDVSKLSSNKKIENEEEAYQLVVLAGIETGVITLSEVDHILKFEDFWNPKFPAWKKWVSFSLSIGATASLALPIPWNFLSAGSLTLLKASMFTKKKPGKDHENIESIF